MLFNQLNECEAYDGVWASACRPAPARSRVSTRRPQPCCIWSCGRLRL